MSITKDFLNRNTVNFSLGLMAPTNTVGAGLSPTSFTSTNDTINQSRNFQPSLYYDYLKNYPYLQTLVNIIKAPIEEALNQMNTQIKVTTDKKDNTLINDAVIIANNFFENCDLKKYILDHLDDFILRGSYLSYIDYRENKLLDTIDPYNFYMIHNGTDYSWIIPANASNTLLQNNSSDVFNGTSSRNLAPFFNDTNIEQGFPGHKFIKYFYKTETVKRETRGILNNTNIADTKLYNSLLAVLGGHSNIKTAQKLTKEEKEHLDNILVLYSIQRPKSLFEPYLKSLFILSLKEMVFDLISLLQYLKTDYFTVNVKSSVQRNERLNIIAKNIQSALNKYNMDIIKTYEDPSGILAAVIDKLVNRNEVLPLIDEFSDIQTLVIPDLDQRLNVMYNDILDSKKRLADEIGVAQESISGNSNRWEAISRNEKSALNIMSIKTTIENFVKSTACVVVYNHLNENYWLDRLKKEGEPTVFNFSNISKKLSDKDDGINNLLIQFSKNYGQDQIKSGAIGVMLKPNVFGFDLNLSTILDSYATKTKETIIVENIQSTSSLLDSIKTLINTHGDLLDGSQVSTYVQKLLNIADYANSIIDSKKLTDFIEAHKDGMSMDPMMEDPNAMPPQNNMENGYY